MATSIETKAKRNELETKMVLNGEPTNVSIEVIEEDGRFCVQCLVDSNNFDGVEVLDQIHSWASLFGVELPLERVAVYYRDPAQTRDMMEDEFDLIDDLCDFGD